MTDIKVRIEPGDGYQIVIVRHMLKSLRDRLLKHLEPLDHIKVVSTWGRGGLRLHHYRKAEDWLFSYDDPAEEIAHRIDHVAGCDYMVDIDWQPRSKERKTRDVDEDGLIDFAELCEGWALTEDECGVLRLPFPHIPS